MYRILLIAAIVFLAGCRAKEESLKSATQIKTIDSSSASFKRSLSTNTLTNSELVFTTDEYEYRDQTSQEKQQGIPAKPRLKSRTTGTLKSNTAEKKDLAETGEKKDLNKTQGTTTEDKHVKTSPMMPVKVIIIGVLILLAAAVYVCYRFNLVTKIKDLVKRLA